MLRITVNAKEFEALCARVKAAGGQMRSWLLVWGNAVAKEARTNARQKGGRSFWREIAQATRVERAGTDSVSVANYHVAGGHKQTGGPIETKDKKALTIPLTDEAKRKRAAEFELGGRKLFRPGPPGQKANVLGYADEDGVFHPLFALVKRTRAQAAEPWFPDAPRVSAIGLQECERFVQGLIT